MEVEEFPRLYVGNLPYVAQKADIAKLFADNDIPIKNIDISIDPFTGRNPSYCFVDFNTAADAYHAMLTIRGQSLRGREVKINFKTEKRMVRHQPGDSFRVHSDKSDQASAYKAIGDLYVFDRWALSDEAPDRWTAPSEEGRRLYVGGMPRIYRQYEVDEDMRHLFQAFKLEAVSRIISPPPCVRTLPGSHYYCFVDLASAEEAQNAVNALDGVPTPYGGDYKVRHCSQKRPTKAHREQGLPWQPQKPEPPKRNLEGSWRRSVD